MKKWMFESVVALLVVMAVAVATPPQARADTDDVLIYTAAGAAVAIVIVLVATYFTRDEDQLFVAEPQEELQEELDDQRTIHAGADCVRPDGTVALLCW